ncbi:MAG: isoaspartyl peptidase/L-asparaginase [Verrucomicrobia bacterium]|nr:isoaspartyl peptidase/L-asparaginase [Verrucomicrobiota bacterium]
MNTSFALLAVTAALLMSHAASAAEPAAPITLVIHGGAGAIPRAEMTADKEKGHRAALEASLRAGHAVLKAGGAALDAVVAAIQVLEDSPLHNAGKGAVLTAEGTVEMDASIMDGATRRAGAVAAVKHPKNPIVLARLVMDKSPHVLMTGEGAEIFGKQHGVTMMPPDYFITDQRRQQLERILRSQKQKDREKPRSEFEMLTPAERAGTVGAVALDGRGNLAAGTSTGGMVNKKFGRVGDSPIVGAGTFADNRTCGVSGTGHGEFFIRGVVAYDVAALMEYKGLKLAEAADLVVMKKLKELGGTGGIIALDRRGNVAMPFNTEGMFRGVMRADGSFEIAIYRD